MKKILLIEDNELNLKLFYDVLTFKNYLVDKALDGLEGYKKIVENEYNLIILDIQLPKLDGFSLIEKLKKENKKLPEIIVVSACAMDCDKNKAKSLGINTYLTKPIELNNFILTVEKSLN